MEIKTLVLGPLETNCYIVIKDGKAIIIDPADNPEHIINACKPYEVKEILVTHEHFDHIGALVPLEDYYQMRRNIKSGEFAYEVLANPGHTGDSKSFFFPEEKVMFDGDFIFKNAIGRVDFPESSPAQMCKSIRNLLQMPDDIVLYPGHGESTTIGDERESLSRIL